ncbi:response regulator [Nitratireductor basaltis]|uniref:Response regulator receiver protein n=1 Tax=Nitratireductor basaltis TaxID=472175 RepID=A0A084U9M7_9HYPH|nr:response regulator [Nitratireductor basaltis]KFB09663.1 Response regulator receiver protein [Nitratireductor basaltis]
MIVVNAETAPQDLNDIRVLVVEDEALVAMNLEMMLEDFGCAVIGPAMRFDKAKELLENGVDADVAILDVNVGGTPVFPLAELLVQQNIPMVFATGYDRSGIPEEWHHRPILQKPYTADDVQRGISQALANAAAAK